MIFQNTKILNANLSAFVHDEDDTLRPAVIVCPGGGYHFNSVREAEPIALYYYNAGMNAFLLRYSICENASDYTPLKEVATAVKYVRENASSFHTASDKIVTCGFSAGGHLAASAGILWNIPELRDALGIEDGTAPEGINRPDGMILSYPVITAGKYAHRGSINNLMGSDKYELSDADKFSLELHVNKTTPPMFIWHTATDTCVPVQNTTILVNRYIDEGLSFEAHIYPKGHHGLSLATVEVAEGNLAGIDPHVATWAALSVMWIKDMFK